MEVLAVHLPTGTVGAVHRARVAVGIMAVIYDVLIRPSYTQIHLASRRLGTGAGAGERDILTVTTTACLNR